MRERPIRIGRSHAVGAAERRSLRRRRVRRRCRPMGGGGGHLFGGPEGALTPLRLEFGPYPPHPARSCYPLAARSALAGTATRVAELADGAGPTAHIPGDVAAATFAAADLSVGLRGHFREVSGARQKCVMCVRVATCRAVARPDAAAAAAALLVPRAHVAHGSPRPVHRVGAGCRAVPAPSQRCRSAPSWPAAEAARRPATNVTAAAPSCRRPARLVPPTAASEACAERLERARRPAGTPGVRPAGAIFAPREGAISPAPRLELF